jgi:tetratricopeptide (TPR) repeat protein
MPRLQRWLSVSLDQSFLKLIGHQTDPSQRKLDKAIEYYKKAIDLKPQHVVFSLGAAYERQGNRVVYFSSYDKPTEASCLRRRVESVELRIAVKQCEVGILAGPYGIAETGLPRLLNSD